MDIVKASKKLSELDIQITIDNIVVDILWFRVMDLNGVWSINRHTHSSFEFHFVSSGACIVVLDDGQFVAREGEFYVTAPGIYHEQKSIGNGHYVEYSINCDFKKMKMDNGFSEADNILKVLSSASCIPIKDCYNAIEYFNLALEEADNQKIGFYNNIKCLASIIITMATRAISKNSVVTYNVPLKAKEDDYRFTMIEKFIEDNISSNITTVDIANYMHLSDKQVCRIVRKKTGGSTKSLINSIKLKKAKDLLKNTGLSIKEIANVLGFSSEYYFNQFFKREEGYPPGVYRNNVKNV
ncbi:transcriptional regulator, AraC family [Caldanaerobius fijiensis DSM 17918]|uniref:Transcriptional regulator, AraC family n=1 Tax=Caldanaerobius fijiensis DSM 17918 TaxID=1121256 RepID=A0A1M4SX39_9THEO|nr:AraC family transcriptional regulator [Caldanaerobius fijiensis]SHE36708.1 transcriptional regulator, AraC family [Caldanaerobius fijiensis DSM 17918]